jgi:hypothetical protein
VSLSRATKRSEAESPNGSFAFSLWPRGDVMLKFALLASLFIITLITYTAPRLS